MTKYNPRLPKINVIIKKHISILHSDDALKTFFPADFFSTIYKRNKNLKELIAPSVYPGKLNTRRRVLQVVILVIFARIRWFLLIPLFVQSLLSLIL